MKKIRVLHISRDDKFFDSVFVQFESDHRLDNKAVLEVKNKAHYIFRRIKIPQKINLLTKIEMRATLRNGEYDVLFFYSMPRRYYDYFEWIPNDKIVIWWGWGVELYKPICRLKPLIPVLLYKPLTTQVLKEIAGNTLSALKAKIGYSILKPWNSRLQKKMLRRIDFFQPVLSQEFHLMERLEDFHAKEFYYPNCFPFAVQDSLISKNDKGSILIGNSQAPTNNHLDVWQDIRDFLPEHRKVIFPLNYLGDKKYAKLIIERIESDRNELLFLQDFLASNDYFALMDTCSYAVFGVLRQQAMGNIYYCLEQGIKVFLYKNSVVYKCLKDAGYVVYTIEDIDDNSFVIPLTREEIHRNAEAFKKDALYRNSISEKVIDEILGMERI